MGRRFAAFILLFALVAGACTDNAGVDSDADVTISGRVADASAAVDDARVKVRKTLMPDEYGGARLDVLHDLGFACVDERAPDACWKVDRETRPDDGRFALEMKGHDTNEPSTNCDRAFIGGGPCAQAMHAAAIADAAKGELTGPTTAARFVVQETHVELPTLELWRPTLEVSADETSNVLRWGDPPRSTSPVGHLVLAEGPDGSLVWGMLAPPVGHVRIDGRLLEGFVAGLSVVALDASGRLAYRSARIPVRGGAGEPVSRGAACDGSACPLTDGALDAVETIAPLGRSPVIDLGHAVTPSLVAVRGCGQCTVEVSTDGRSWSSHPTGPVMFTDSETVEELEQRGEEYPEELPLTSAWLELLEPTGEPAADATKAFAGALVTPALPGLVLADGMIAFTEALGDLFSGGSETPYDWSGATPAASGWVAPEGSPALRYVRVEAPESGAELTEVSVWTIDGPAAAVPIETVDASVVGWPAPAEAPVDWVSVLGRIGLALLAVVAVGLVVIGVRRRRERRRRMPPPPPPTFAHPPPPPPAVDREPVGVPR